MHFNYFAQRVRLRRIVRFCKFSAVAIIKNTNSVQQKNHPHASAESGVILRILRYFYIKKITNSVRRIKYHPHASAESGVFIILIEFYYFAQYVRLRRIVRFCKFSAVAPNPERTRCT